jgi:hypothetical protein
MSMRATADRLRATADEVRAVVASIGERVSSMSYAGPAADRFRSAMGQRVAQLIAAAGHMEALGSQLTTEAAALEAAQIEQARRALVEGA